MAVVSIHTLHELEARRSHKKPDGRALIVVSIHTLHELEASVFSADANDWQIFCFHSYASRIGSKINHCANPNRNALFPFIRFTNWKQDVPVWNYRLSGTNVSIHTLHELEARILLGLFLISNIDNRRPNRFPFIRFTNWKQA